MKRRIEPYSFYDHTGIAAHLEDMAARGWMLKSVGAFTWNYEKCEPVKAHFAVTYYPRLSEFDPADNPDLASFAEFCAPSEHTTIPFNWRAPGLVLAFSAFFDASLTSQPFYPFCAPR